MLDEEFIELRNKFLLALGVALLFTVPLVIFFYKTTNNDTSVIKDIDKKKSIIVLMTDNRHKNYKKIIKKSSIKYHIINKDKNSSYKELEEKLSISDNDIVLPTAIYVKKGKLHSTLVDIQSEKDLEVFLKNIEVIK